LKIFIPACLQKEAQAGFGDEGTRWLNSLPQRIAALEQEWGFRTGPALDHGGCVSWVAPVELEGGGEAILKIGIPHDEARFEAEALRFLNGQGAVRLLRASDDGFSLLLERCVPGTDLWSLSEEAADDVACTLLPRLWQQPTSTAPFESLTDTVARWCEELPHEAPAAGYDARLVDRALEHGRELAASQPQSVLLHGDFHPGNVLAARREPWLMIDPKPLVGDPAYDLAQWLHNRYEAATHAADPVAVLCEQIDRFAGRLGLDPARIAGWAFVKALGWEQEPPVVDVFHTVAEAW